MTVGPLVAENSSVCPEHLLDQGRFYFLACWIREFTKPKEECEIEVPAKMDMYQRFSQSFLS